MRGAGSKAIMDLARHASLGVTQRTMHLSPDSRREAIDLLDARPLRQHNDNAEVEVDVSVTNTGESWRKRTGIEPA
jgi:hypothetical protein